MIDGTRKSDGPGQARYRSRNGFATIVAVFAVGLVAAALAVAAAGSVADMRRTGDGAVTAQLRQLLLAGGVDVASRAAAWPAAPVGGTQSLALPADLAAAGYAVTVRVQPEAVGVAVTVDAIGDGRHARQRLDWVRTAGRWRVTTARLGT